MRRPWILGHNPLKARPGLRLLGAVAMVVQLQLCLCPIVEAAEPSWTTEAPECTSCHVDGHAEQGRSSGSAHEEPDCCCSPEVANLQATEATQPRLAFFGFLDGSLASPSSSVFTALNEIFVSNIVVDSTPPLARQSAPFLSLRI